MKEYSLRYFRLASGVVAVHFKGGYTSMTAVAQMVRSKTIDQEPSVDLILRHPGRRLESWLRYQRKLIEDFSISEEIGRMAELPMGNAHYAPIKPQLAFAPKRVLRFRDLDAWWWDLTRGTVVRPHLNASPPDDEVIISDNWLIQHGWGEDLAMWEAAHKPNG